jgi:predicted Zn-dependent protease
VGVTPALGAIWLEQAETTDSPSALGKALQVLEPLAARGDASGAVLALYGRALLAADRVQAAEPVLLRATARLPIAPRVFTDLEAAAMRLGHAEVARAARARYTALTCQTDC